MSKRKKIDPKAKSKRSRAEQLNEPPRLPRLPKGTPCAIFTERAIVRCRRDVEKERDSGAFLTYQLETYTGDLDLSAPNDAEELLDDYAAMAEAIFEKHECDNNRECAHAGWDANGCYGACRTKFGHFARDLLHRIAAYRRMRKEKPAVSYEADLLHIGRLSMALECLDHEENASLGAERRRINRKGGIARREKFTAYIEDDARIPETVEARIKKGDTVKQAREIVAPQHVPPFRKGEYAASIHPATLRRRKIGCKKD